MENLHDRVVKAEDLKRDLRKALDGIDDLLFEIRGEADLDRSLQLASVMELFYIDRMSDELMMFLDLLLRVPKDEVRGIPQYDAVMRKVDSMTYLIEGCVGMMDIETDTTMLNEKKEETGEIDLDIASD